MRDDRREHGCRTPKLETVGCPDLLRNYIISSKSMDLLEIYSNAKMHSGTGHSLDTAKRLQLLCVAVSIICHAHTHSALKP